MLTLVGILLAPVAAVPTYIGCDFVVISSKSSAGRNVMTTTENIMGSPPSDDDTLAVASASTFTAGSTVSVTFSSKFVKGFAHATAGTFTAPLFTGTAHSQAAQCTGTDTMVYKTGFGASSITWTAPNDVMGLPSVTLSFAGGAGSAVSRRALTLTRQPATTSTASTGTGRSTFAETTTTTQSPTTTTATWVLSAASRAGELSTTIIGLLAVLLSMKLMV